MRIFCDKTHIGISNYGHIPCINLIKWESKMAIIDWKTVWDNSLHNKEMFPIKAINNSTVSISCPTRFSGTGKFSIEVTPSFNKSSITLSLLMFNENLLLSDLPATDKQADSEETYNKLVDRLVQYELSNRIMERFSIKSEGFKSDKEAEDALVDYINSKATESGRMFDDKLDELNDLSDKKEGYAHIVESIRNNRKFLLQKVESILNSHFGWKASKHEDYSDSVASLYDKNGNLAAVVSLADKCVVVDLSKDMTAKVSLMKSDEEIEQELVSDVNNAQGLLADREIEQLKEVVANNEDSMSDDEDEFLESLTNRITKLESLYIRNKLNRRVRD